MTALYIIPFVIYINITLIANYSVDYIFYTVYFFYITDRRVRKRWQNQQRPCQLVPYERPYVEYKTSHEPR